VGALVGLVVAGGSARLAMGLIALADDREDFGALTGSGAFVGEVTFGGTVAVLATGTALGIMIIDLAFVIWFGAWVSAAVRLLLARKGDLFDELGRYPAGLLVGVWGLASVSIVASGADDWWRWLLVDAAAFATAIYTLWPRRPAAAAGRPAQARDGAPGRAVERARPDAAVTASWWMEQAIAYAFLAACVYGFHEAFARIVVEVRASIGLGSLAWTSSERLTGEVVVFAFGVTASLASVGLLLMLLNGWLRRRSELIAGWRHQRSVLLVIAAAPIAACLLPSLEHGSLLGGVLLRLSLLFYAFWRDRGCPPERATDFLKSPWSRALGRVRRTGPRVRTPAPTADASRPSGSKRERLSAPPQNPAPLSAQRRPAPWARCLRRLWRRWWSRSPRPWTRAVHGVLRRSCSPWRSRRLRCGSGSGGSRAHSENRCDGCLLTVPPEAHAGRRKAVGRLLAAFRVLHTRPN
jgi:hypothetical protein